MKKTARSFFIIFLLCIFTILILFLKTTQEKITLCAQDIALSPYSEKAPLPQNIRDVYIPDNTFPDSTRDSSISNTNTRYVCSLNMFGTFGKRQNFIFTGMYGPSPSAPTGEGGSSFWAINIYPYGSSSDRYVYAPKNVWYEVKFIDIKGSILKTIKGTSAVEYQKYGYGNNKKVIGWLYGFFDPAEFKEQLGERRFWMTYRIEFVTSDPSNILQFNLFEDKAISSSGAPQLFTAKPYTTRSYAPTDGRPVGVGAGITPRAGGGVKMGYGVDMVSGSLTQDFVDMTLPGGLNIIRHYNSGMGYQPGRSFGWMFNFEEFLRFDPDGSIFYRNYNFKEFRFIKKQSAASKFPKQYISDVFMRAAYEYIPAKPGNFLKLKQITDGNYEITFENQTRKIFNAMGYLIKAIDASGNVISYTWELPVGQIRKNHDIPDKLMAIMGPLDIFRSNQSLIITDPYGRKVYVYFNKSGRVNVIRDWAGRSTEYTWDNKEGIYLLKYKDIEGNYTNYVSGGSSYYPLYNQIRAVNYPNGTAIQNFYINDRSYNNYAPNSQEVSRQITLTGSAITYNYGWLENTQERWTKVNDNGKITIYYYDENGSITKIISPGADNTIAEYKFSSYKDKNLLSSFTDPLGRRIIYRYDERGNPTQIDLPDGKSIKYKYNDKNQLTDYWDKLGRRTHYEYDSRNNLISIEKIDGAKISFKYDLRGNVTETTNENGYSWKYEYSSYENLIKIIDPEGGTAVFYPDTIGRPLAIDVNGARYRFQYNNSNRITQITDPMGNSVNISYDRNGNISSVINPEGNASMFEYDVLNRLTRLINAEGGIESYLYDVRGNMVRVTDPMGRDIAFEYNVSDYVTLVRNQNFKSTYYNYNVISNITSVSNPQAGKKTVYQYDELNRLIQKIADNNARYVYNDAGNIKTISDNSGNTSYEYDQMDRLIKKVYPFKNTAFERRFDKAGNIIYEKHLNKEEFYYAYDKANKLLSITKKGAGSPLLLPFIHNQNNGTLTYKYNQNKDLVMVEYPNKVTEYITYDDAKRIVRIKYMSPKSGEIIYQVDYGYNTAGKIVNKQVSGAGYSKKNINYTYDKAGRLVGVKTNNTVVSEYAYDKNGNRLSSRTQTGKVQYWYDNANQLLKTSQTEYSYDAAGNITSANTGEKEKSYNKKYSYDKENNLTAIDSSGTGKQINELYHYSADNTRASSLSKGRKNQTFTCWFDGELLGEVDNSGNIEFINYRYGFKDKTGDYYYVTDIQGSVVGLTDKGGDLATAYEYDEFGNPMSTMSANDQSAVIYAPKESPQAEAPKQTTEPQVYKQSSGAAGKFSKFIIFLKKLFGMETKDESPKPTLLPITNNVESPLRFSGYCFDKETGLYYLQSRYYDPRIGRFTQADKISYASGLNLYAYCNNDPVNYVDPWGFTGELTSIDEIIAVAEGNLKYLYEKAVSKAASSQIASTVKNELRTLATNRINFLSKIKPRASAGVSIDYADIDKMVARNIMKKAGRSEADIRAVEAEIDQGYARLRSEVFNVIPIVTYIKKGRLPTYEDLPTMWKQLLDLNSWTWENLNNAERARLKYLTGSGNGSGAEGADATATGSTGGTSGSPSTTSAPEAVPSIQYVSVSVLSKSGYDSKNKFYYYSVRAAFLWKPVPGAYQYRIDISCNGNHDLSWWCRSWYIDKKSIHTTSLTTSGYSSAEWFNNGTSASGFLHEGLSGVNGTTGSLQDSATGVTTAQGWFLNRFAGWTAVVTAIK